MNESIEVGEKQFRVQAGFTVAPEYDSKGQLKSGIKLWMSCGFDEVEDAKAWLTVAVADAVVLCSSEMGNLEKGDV